MRANRQDRISGTIDCTGSRADISDILSPLSTFACMVNANDRSVVFSCNLIDAVIQLSHLGIVVLGCTLGQHSVKGINND